MASTFLLSPADEVKNLTYVKKQKYKYSYNYRSGRSYNYRSGRNMLEDTVSLNCTKTLL
jgi:hypothetical protein